MDNQMTNVLVTNEQALTWLAKAEFYRGTLLGITVIAVAGCGYCLAELGQKAYHTWQLSKLKKTSERICDCVEKLESES